MHIIGTVHLILHAFQMALTVGYISESLVNMLCPPRHWEASDTLQSNQYCGGNYLIYVSRDVPSLLGGVVGVRCWF